MLSFFLKKMYLLAILYNSLGSFDSYPRACVTINNGA